MEGGARPWLWFSARVLGCLPVMEAVLTEELDEEEQLVRRHRKEILSVPIVLQEKNTRSSFYESTGGRLRSLRHVRDVGTHVYMFDV